eukprot:484099-Hanusia_phi.AAC.1
MTRRAHGYFTTKTPCRDQLSDPRGFGTIPKHKLVTSDTSETFHRSSLTPLDLSCPPLPPLPQSSMLMEVNVLLNQERYETQNKKQIAKENPPQNRTRGR